MKTKLKNYELFYFWLNSTNFNSIKNDYAIMSSKLLLNTLKPSISQVKV